LPYWDLYDYAGHPFYVNLSIMHLINPACVSVIAINKFFKLSLFTLYHWNFLVHLLIAGLGVYFFSRHVYKYPITRYLVLFTFIFSSFTYICLRQAGFLYTFIWFPWALLYLIMFVKRPNLYNSCGLGLFLGMSMNGYQGLYVVVFLAVFMGSLYINQRNALKSAFKKENIRNIPVVIILVFILALPLASVFLDKDDFVPMARMRTSPVITDSYENRTGAVPAKIKDFLGLVNRDIAVKGYFEKKIQLSEGFLYVGILTLLFVIIGVCFSKGAYKLNFLLSLVFVILIMLGGSGGMQRIVNLVFPPFRFVRHMQLWAGIFIFNLIYFAGLGIDHMMARLEGSKKRLLFMCCVSIFTLFDLITYGQHALGYVTLPRKNMAFNEHLEGYKYRPYRDARLVTYDQIRYFKPILYKNPTVFNAATVPKQLSRKHLKNDLYDLYFGMAFREGFSYSYKAREMNIGEFLAYGKKEFAVWPKHEKTAFLDLLSIIVIDLATHKDFFSQFNGVMEGLVKADRGIKSGHKRIVSGGRGWTGYGISIDRILNAVTLKGKVSPGAEKRSFDFLGRAYDFKRRVGLHNYTFGNISVVKYLEYLWAFNHVEEFTLLLGKDYLKLISGVGRAGDDKKRYILTKNIMSIAGIENEILRFYYKARTIDDDSFLGLIKNEALPSDTLFIMDDMPVAVPDEQTGGARNIFMYNLTEYSPNTIGVELETDRDGYLYYSDNYDKYWKVYIDGKRALLLRANLVFKAVKVPAGKHKIKFIYDPGHFKLSILLYYAAIIICASSMVYMKVSGKRGQPYP